MFDTRIKVVSEYDSISYTCQYKTGWQLLYTWHDMHIDLETTATFKRLQYAQKHIDEWLVRQEEYAEADRIKALKKETMKIEYVKYP